MKKLLIILILYVAFLATSAAAKDYREIRPASNIKPYYNTNYSANNYYQTRYDRGPMFGRKDSYKYWKKKMDYVEVTPGS